MWEVGLEIKNFECGWCGSIASARKFPANKISTTFSFSSDVDIYICSDCKHPTMYYRGDRTGKRFPEKRPARNIEHVPDNVNNIYHEVLRAYTLECFSLAVMGCRKLIMHLAVERGAKEGQSFEAYIDYLADQRFIPPDTRHIVDKIRKKANTTNHEIVINNPQEALDLIKLCELILIYNYEIVAKFIKANPA